MDPAKPVKSEHPNGDTLSFWCHDKVVSVPADTEIEKFWNENKHHHVMKQFRVSYSPECWGEFYHYNPTVKQFEKCFEEGEKLPIVEYIFIHTAGGEGYFPTLIGGELKTNSEGEVDVWVRSKCYYEVFPNDSEKHPEEKQEFLKDPHHKKLGEDVFGVREIYRNFSKKK